MAKTHLSRANVYIKHGSSGVYLYTQTRGDSLPKILRSALLRGRKRWGNTPVLTRIVFGEMIGSDVLNLDGFGISTELSDNDKYILVVDDQGERVGIFTESAKCLGFLPFEEYVNLPDDMLNWRSLGGGYEAVEQDYDHDLANAHTPGKDPYPFPYEDTSPAKAKNKTTELMNVFGYNWNVTATPPPPPTRPTTRPTMTRPTVNDLELEINNALTATELELYRPLTLNAAETPEDH